MWRRRLMNRLSRWVEHRSFGVLCPDFPSDTREAINIQTIEKACQHVDHSH